MSFEDLGTHFVQSKLSSISTVGVVVVVEKYFKNGSRPSNQVTNKEKKTRKRKENSRSRAYISEASAVYRLIYQFKSDSDSIGLQFATNTVCAKEAKLNGKRENKGGKVREAKRKKRHRRHRRYCATANIFKQTLRSRRWSSFPHQKIFPNDTQREGESNRERESAKFNGLTVCTTQCALTNRKEDDEVRKTCTRERLSGKNKRQWRQIVNDHHTPQELGALIGPITRKETIHGLGCLLNNQFKARYRGVNIKWTMTRRREGLYRMKIYENLAIVKCFGEGKNMCLENVLNQVEL